MHLFAIKTLKSSFLLLANIRTYYLLPCFTASNLPCSAASAANLAFSVEN
jgi:hypothetical protein